MIDRHKGGKSKAWKAPEATFALSSTTLVPVSSSNQSFTMDESTLQRLQQTHELPQIASQLPMLASSCPGWICFAEKNHPQAIPYISTTKSPQQLLGTLVKAICQADQSLHSSSRPIYLVSIQPCFDKKLEASRKVSVYFVCFGGCDQSIDRTSSIFCQTRKTVLLKLTWCYRLWNCWTC